MSWSADAVRGGAVACAALAALAGGCGFQPAESRPLAPVLRSVFIASGQPYGTQENSLRRALQRQGARVVLDRRKATAILQILDKERQRNVLAVDANGRPSEYAISYLLRFRVISPGGDVLVPGQSLRLRREYAYSVKVELGANLEESDVYADLEREATRLVLLRMEAVGKPGPAATAAPPAGT